MRRFVVILLLFLCCRFAAAQEFDPACWLSSLDDAIPVSSLSVPGAHDAATGEGLRFAAGFGKTQALGLSAQWDCGVRAFDLRPAVDGGGLHIYHGPIKTRISFADAMALICGKLEKNPGEFAIVLLRNEGRDGAEWSSAVGETIESMGDRVAGFTPDMTVGDLRGKVLFLSRDRYSGCDRGAYITGWSHSHAGTTGGRAVPYVGGKAAHLNVQDFYNAKGEERQDAKALAVLKFLDLAGNADDNTWTINFLSGYGNTWLGITPFATSAGYKRNAERVNTLVLDRLSSRQAMVSAGILFMDFAGVDEVSGGIWHWGKFHVMGRSLVKRIIEINFR